jgi:hypothetical protein
MWRFAIAALLSLTAGCANVNYAKTEPGKISGEMAVVWLKGTQGGSGDGTFVYVPTQRDPLTFTRPEGKDRGNTITPSMIYTDGGSVPSFARMFDGLTPWHYGPAYIVHDWLFRARQCLNDDSANPEYRQIADLTFEDSAEIIAESIKALEDSGRVKKSAVSGAIVTGAVTSPFSYALWVKKHACNEVSDADAALAYAAVGRTPRVGREAGLRTYRTAEGKLVRDSAAEVVAIISN